MSIFDKLTGNDKVDQAIAILKKHGISEAEIARTKKSALQDWAWQVASGKAESSDENKEFKMTDEQTDRALELLEKEEVDVKQFKQFGQEIAKAGKKVPKFSMKSDENFDEKWTDYMKEVADLASEARGLNQSDDKKETPKEEPKKEEEKEVNKETPKKRPNLSLGMDNFPSNTDANPEVPAEITNNPEISRGMLKSALQGTDGSELKEIAEASKGEGVLQADRVMPANQFNR